MTGWIKMGTGLGSHPKVKTMRRALKAERLRVVGGLWAVWCVFDEHSAAGRLDGYTLDDMDEEIGWKGFSAAMKDIGWLLEDEDGLEAPDYEEHNGPNAKRRALDSSRKGKSRAKGSAEAPDDDPPEKRTDVRKESGTLSASDADKTRNREEKRREEVGIHSGANAPGAAAPPGPEPKALTAKDRVWLLGPTLLGDAPSVRGLLGKLAKTHGDDVLATVLAEATMERPIEPKSWVTAACEARSKAHPKANGHETFDLLADDKPAWALNAGFVNRFEAENAGCREHNAANFRGGRRLAA